MKLLDKMRAYRRVLSRAKRNKSDMTRLLARHPQVAFAISTYEAAALFSGRVDARLKTLAAIKTSALVGCPF